MVNLIRIPCPCVIVVDKAYFLNSGIAFSPINTISFLISLQTDTLITECIHDTMDRVNMTVVIPPFNPLMLAAAKTARQI